mmetsp:Transcript_39772/g.55230  ORF Transcript_39772/g.55230 Transcript_39772/m.55230 type:complete len:221 (+) Transcript_39772:378-1040(+)|eukprot:CAMPEP_0196578488 /NCGR_PEP_ID=MMETSP1081-20130531/7385_1 /TAXON_ID=36882 /ORGANISM="Pyramimonas amylifera, Strain CCMP720" /LENGTH=220 /DNA_ID=CAMNT_0041897729 /DNA_START=285 /DNA_END=947 /DNA_ORIENTATION=+
MSFGPVKSKESNKNEVSSETQKLIDSMLKQTDLSHRQQKAMKAHLTGAAPPSGIAKTKKQPVAVPVVGKGSGTAPLPMCGRFSGIKLKSDIVRENPEVYQREQFRGGGNVGRNGDIEKDKLAKTMEYKGRSAEQRQADLDKYNAKLAAEEAAKLKQPEVSDRDAMIDEVLQSISERQLFLEDMRAMGQAEKYEKQIKSEVSTKLALLKRMGVDLKSGSVS